MGSMMDRITAGGAGGPKGPRRPRRPAPRRASGANLTDRAGGLATPETSVELPASTAPDPGPLQHYETASGFARTVIVALLFASPAILPILAATPVLDPDIWWHLATGKWIQAHGALPTLDPFHSGDAQSPWVAYSWLFETSIYGLYEKLGLHGLFLYSVLASLAVTAAVYRLLRRREPRFLASALLTGLVTLAVWRHQGARTFLLTIMFTALELDVLWTARRGRKAVLLWLLPLFVVWANIHIQFVYGLGILGLAALESLIDRARGLPRWLSERDGYPLRWILPISIGAFAATLVNPFAWKVYLVVHEYVTQLAPWTYLGELRAPEFRSVFDWVVLASALGGAFALGRNKPLRPFPLLLLIAASLLSFRALRDTWFVAMVGALLIADRGLSFRRPMLTLALAGRSLRGAIVTAALLAGVWSYADTADADLDAAMARRFPVGATEFMKAQGYRGRIYNHFNWGGYLIWQLPEMEVSIDGRTNVYGDEALRRSMTTWAGGAAWDEDPLLRKANAVVAAQGEPLTSILRSDRRYRKVYEDEVAAVFVPAAR